MKEITNIVQGLNLKANLIRYSKNFVVWNVVICRGDCKR